LPLATGAAFFKVRTDAKLRRRPRTEAERNLYTAPSPTSLLRNDWTNPVRGRIAAIVVAVWLVYEASSAW